MWRGSLSAVYTRLAFEWNRDFLYAFQCITLSNLIIQDWSETLSQTSISKSNINLAYSCKIHFLSIQFFKFAKLSSCQIKENRIVCRCPFLQEYQSSCDRVRYHYWLKWMLSSYFFHSINIAANLLEIFFFKRRTICLFSLIIEDFVAEMISKSELASRRGNYEFSPLISNKVRQLKYMVIKWSCGTLSAIVRRNRDGGLTWTYRKEF